MYAIGGQLFQARANFLPWDTLKATLTAKMCKNRNRTARNGAISGLTPVIFLNSAGKACILFKR